MALDVQRPDPSSPAAVASAQFSIIRRGYREEEVRDFLRQVSVELGRLIERERFLESELRALQARGPVDLAAIDEVTITELLGAESARVLSSAREAAQAIRDRAAESAEQIVREASREATRQLEEAAVEASRRRSDVSTEAEQEIELAKQQGREMVAEVRAYRERVLADVARRTEEARRELERIIHERERILTAFERARHAASEVVGDLNEFDEAIREIGIVPPLVPPDAPAPPQTGGRSDAPLFDAKHYEAELRAAHRTTDTTDTSVLADGRDADGSHQMETTTESASELVQGEESPAEDPASSVSVADEIVVEEIVVEESLVDESQHSIAPVVSILDHRRRRDATGEVGTEVHNRSDSSHDSALPRVGQGDGTPKDSSLLLEESAPLHPVFERREARESEASVDQVEPITPSDRNSRVEDVFERLRSISTERVAEDTTRDLKKGAAVDPFARRRDVLEPFLPKVARILKRALTDEENSAITHVSGNRNRLVLEEMFGADSEQVARLLDPLQELVNSIAIDAARTTTTARRSDLRTKMNTGALADRVSQHVLTTLVQPLRRELEELLNGSNGDRDRLIAGIRSTFASWRGRELSVTVDDLAHFAYARGLFLGCESGSPTCWLVDPSGPPCADGEDNSLAGMIRRGDAFPTGHLHPLAHRGCRCLVVPIDK